MLAELLAQQVDEACAVKVHDPALAQLAGHRTGVADSGKVPLITTRLQQESTPRISDLERSKQPIISGDLPRKQQQSGRVGHQGLDRARF